MTRALAAAFAVSLCGCGGTGAVTFTTWGEEYIEAGLPSTLFADGWSVTYTKFLITFRAITIDMKPLPGAKPSTPAFVQARSKVFDEAKPGPAEILTTPQLPAQRWNRVHFRIAPDADAEAGSGVTTADLELLRVNGYAVYVEGHGDKGAERVDFSWGFAKDTLFDDCRNEDVGGEGVVVPTGATETVQLTVHGDHLFYDDLQSPDAVPRFEAIAAADSNHDHAVSQAELRAVLLTTLPPAQYGTGSAARVKNLEDFIGELSRTLGHYRGEGECTSKPQG